MARFVDTKKLLTSWGYKYLAELGEGRAGSVHLVSVSRGKPFAQRGDLLAVKVYKPEILGRPNVKPKLKQVFKNWSKLRHPNLVNAYDFHHEPEGLVAHLVMEYFDGKPLDKWAKEFLPLDPRLCLQIFRQCADAVRYLHEAKLIHGDIKPSNILVSPDFQIKLADPGVLNLADEGQRGFTQSDELFGTARYAAAEAIAGEPTTQSDLYSLGGVLYWMHHGFEIYSEAKEPYDLVKLKKGPPRFPPCRGASKLSTKITELERHLLKTHSSDRPRSADEVLREVDEIESARPADSERTTIAMSGSANAFQRAKILQEATDENGRYDAARIARLLDWSASDIALYLGRDPSTISRFGASAVHQQKLASLAALAHEVFVIVRQDRAAMRAWFRTPIRALDRVSPQQAILHGDFKRVSDLVNESESGLAY
jgi:serine/threonine protein kinase